MLGAAVGALPLQTKGVVQHQTQAMLVLLSLLLQCHSRSAGEGARRSDDAPMPALASEKSAAPDGRS